MTPKLDTFFHNAKSGVIFLTVKGRRERGRPFITNWTRVLLPSDDKMSKDKIREQYEYFFKLADTDGDGFVTGGEAAALFRKSGLSDEALRNVRMINICACHMHLVSCGNMSMKARKMQI